MANGIFGSKPATPEAATPAQATPAQATPKTDAPVTDVAAADKLKKQKNEASKRLHDRKSKALTQLIDLAKRLGTPEEKDAALYLEPGRHIAGVPGAPKVRKDVLASLLDTVGATIHEDEVFKQERLGRREMGQLIRSAVGTRWVTFNPDTGTYKLVAMGPTAPEGWVGPLPKAPKAL